MKIKFHPLEKFNSKVDKKRNTVFFQELSILLSSGIDIRSSLDIIISESTKEKDIVLFKGLRESIVSGKSLSEALKQSQAFQSFDYYNILIGEETGNLVATLDLLYEYHARRQENNQKVQSAITYPVIVLIVSVVAVIVMLKFIVPVFADVYARFGHELPTLTRLILKLSNNLGRYLSIVFFFTILFIFLKTQLFKNE
jgi:type IV pilus assembly protein PilC